MKPQKRKKKATGKAEKTQGSLLARLLKGKGKKGKKGASGPTGAPAKEKPATPLDRSIREIKQLLGVGQSDPERLALLLSNILSAERKQKEKDQERFDQMVWDLVDRREQGDGEGAQTTDDGDEGETGGSGIVNGNGKEP